MVITMLPICTQRLIEFKILVYDVFDLSGPFWTLIFPTNAWISYNLVTLDGFCSSFRVVFITMLRNYSQYLIKFEITFRIFSTFFEPL